MAVCHVIILQNILYKIKASYFSLASTSCNPMTPNQHRLILLHEINKTQLFLNILLILLFYIAFIFTTIVKNWCIAIQLQSSSIRRVWNPKDSLLPSHQLTLEQYVNVLYYCLSTTERGNIFGQNGSHLFRGGFKNLCQEAHGAQTPF